MATSGSEGGWEHEDLAKGDEIARLDNRRARIHPTALGSGRVIGVGGGWPWKWRNQTKSRPTEGGLLLGCKETAHINGEGELIQKVTRFNGVSICHVPDTSATLGTRR